jgi:hypothetical protein
MRPTATRRNELTRRAAPRRPVSPSVGRSGPPLHYDLHGKTRFPISHHPPIHSLSWFIRRSCDSTPAQRRRPSGTALSRPPETASRLAPRAGIPRTRSRSGAQPDAFRGGDPPKCRLRADHTTPLRRTRSSLKEGRSTPEWPGDCQPGRTGGPSAPRRIRPDASSRRRREADGQLHTPIAANHKTSG